MTTILVESELRRAVSYDLEALQAIEEAFCWISDKKIDMPRVTNFSISKHRDIDVRGGVVKELDSFAIKLASGFFDNERHGLPSCTSLFALFSTDTGYPLAILLDNGYLASLRTAMAGAIAAKFLAPSYVHTVGVIGTGDQARCQPRALMLTRPFQRLLVYGRNKNHAARYAAEMAGSLDAEITVSDSIDEVVQNSQYVVTTTPSTSPLLLRANIHAGLHITAVGSDMEGKRELHPQVLTDADRVFCDAHVQSRTIGELQGLPAIPRPTELGEIILGRACGRSSDKEVTVCDLTGTGAQDTSIARYAWYKTRERRIGS